MNGKLRFEIRDDSLGNLEVLPAGTLVDVQEEMGCDTLRYSIAALATGIIIRERLTSSQVDVFVEFE